MWHEKGLEIIIAHYGDYHNGTIETGWVISNGEWENIKATNVDFVYDKFPAIDEKTRAIKSDIVNRGIDIFNNPQLELFFKDKYATYESFPDLVPYTVFVNGTYDDLVRVVEDIQSKNLHPDLDADVIIAKPRYGHGGNDIFIIENDYRALNLITHQDYIFQPFLETVNGIPSMDIMGRHDIKIIVLDGLPKLASVQMFIETKDYSIPFQGLIKHLELDNIPKSFNDVVNTVDDYLKTELCRIYSVDMAVGKSGKVWIYELNGKPGQIWDINNFEYIKQTKELQEIILDTLVKAVNG